MELKRYASLLWRWLWLVALASVLGAASSYMVTRSMPRVYEASTTLLVNQAQNPGTLAYNDVLTSQMLTKTYVELVRKRPVLEAAATTLKLPGGPDQLGSMISVQVVRDTMLLDLRADSTNPELAADAANAVAAAFIEANRASQMGQASQSRNALQDQLQSLQRDIRSTSDQLDGLRVGQGAITTDARQAEIARLQNVLSQYQLTYSQLLKSDQDMRLAESKAYSSVAVVEPAVVPGAPVRPNLMQNVTLAAMVGLMLAVGIAALIEYLDDTVKSGDVVTKVLGVPALGYIMRFRKEEMQHGALATALNPRSPLVEAFRVLRTNLQFALVGRPGTALLITSASPGEGKTTVAVSLAEVLAQAGKRVVLVDTDLRRPGVHQQLKLRNDRGVTTVLLEPASLDVDAIQLTDVPNLSVLTSGPLPPNPSELLGSPRMASIVEELKRRADIVIFDSPPALVVTDPSVLASRMDSVLLVVDTGSTRVAGLEQAKEMLERAGGSNKLVGAVLNKLTPRTAGYYYYYYYYYYYGHGPNNGRNGRTEKRNPVPKAADRDGAHR